MVPGKQPVVDVPASHARTLLITIRVGEGHHGIASSSPYSFFTAGLEIYRNEGFAMLAACLLSRQVLAQ